MNHKETDIAWERIRERLAQEPLSEYWSALPASPAKDQLEPVVHGNRNDRRPNAAIRPAELPGSRPSAATGRMTGWMKRRRKWALAAAVAGLLTFSLATSTGNKALAAILNQFRMQEIAVVHENDVRELMYRIMPDGLPHESVNRFGAVSRITGALNGEYRFEEAERLLNRKLVKPAKYSKDQVYLSSTDEITLRLNIHEVNKALKLLGSDALLPESIDGKPVTLKIGNSAHIHHDMTVNGERVSYDFWQQPVPMIEVDASIPVQEALQAVIQFPFLPENIKRVLLGYDALENGMVPLPVVTRQGAETRRIEEVDVVVEKDAAHFNGNIIWHTLHWVEDGQLFTLSGGFADSDAALETAAELIRP